jgi:hypothetical protein
MISSSKLLRLLTAALTGALAGGGYALASGSGKTFSGCVVSKPKPGYVVGELLVKKRCSRGESRITWNQQGVQGAQGVPGMQGPPAPQAWALIIPSTSEATVAAGTNIAAQRLGVGEFQITPLGSCANKNGAFSATAVAPGGGAEAFPTNDYPIAQVSAVEGSPGQFLVQTDLDSGGVLTPADNVQFNVTDSCQ